jgi:anti-sigma factor RsiW
MNDRSCDAIAELLVGYADGELPADEARRVADHLAGCPGCRAELRLLERSLELARDVWHESAARAPTALSLLCATASAEAVPSPTRQEALLVSKQWHTPQAVSSRTGLGRTARHRVFVAACLVACVVVLLLVAGPRLVSVRPSHQEVALPQQTHQRVPPQPAERIDLEAMIAREGRSARLAAAARMLAAQPGLEQYAREAERYLAEVYRGTAAVDGALPPSPSHRNKEPES